MQIPWHVPNMQLTHITNKAQSDIAIKTVKIMVIPVGSIFRQILGMYLDTFRFYVIGMWGTSVCTECMLCPRPSVLLRALMWQVSCHHHNKRPLRLLFPKYIFFPIWVYVSVYFCGDQVAFVCLEYIDSTYEGQCIV